MDVLKKRRQEYRLSKSHSVFELESAGSRNVSLSNTNKSQHRPRSTSQSIHSPSKRKSPLEEQLYNRESIDRSTSFYSAFEDGFHSSKAANSKQLSSIDTMWSCKESLQNTWDISHFEISWINLSYTIQPKFNLFNLAIRLPSKAASTSLKRSRLDKGGRYVFRPQPISILKNACGSTRSGHLTAIIGPSGAGKTTLLNCLSRRRTDGYTGYYQVEPKQQRELSISVIPQRDFLFKNLTAYENIFFASRLKNTEELNFKHEDNILKVAKLLGLENNLHTMTSKLSGGQVKRLSIAQELVSNPDILIMDEPTSGIDSLTCYRTICVLKDIARLSLQNSIKPIAIIVTIHQPQQEVFEIFDKIYCMAPGGLPIYNGTPDQCLKFISRHAQIPEEAQDCNPATLLIEVASEEFGKESIIVLSNRIREDFNAKGASKSNIKYRFSTKFDITSSESIEGIQESVSLSQSFAGEHHTNDSIEEVEISHPISSQVLQVDNRLSKDTNLRDMSFWPKTLLLFQRTWVNYKNEPSPLYVRFLFHLIIAIAMPIFFDPKSGAANACPKFEPKVNITTFLEKSELNQEEMFQSLENVSLYFLICYSIISATTASYTLANVLKIEGVMKEIHNKWYSLPSYLFAEIFSELPLDLIFSFVTLVTIYPLTGQPSSPYQWRFFVILLSLTLGNISGHFIGLTCSTLFRNNLQDALFSSQALLAIPGIFLSGFVRRVKNMTPQLKALTHLSLFRPMVESILLARYGFSVCGECKEEDINGGKIEVVGIPEKLRSMAALISTFQGTENKDNYSSEQDDLFEVFAQQVTMAKSYGVKVTSCDDMKPYQYSENDLKDSLMEYMLYESLGHTIAWIVIYIVVFIITARKASI